MANSFSARRSSKAVMSRWDMAESAPTAGSSTASSSPASLQSRSEMIFQKALSVTARTYTQGAGDASGGREAERRRGAARAGEAEVERGGGWRVAVDAEGEAVVGRLVVR